MAQLLGFMILGFSLGRSKILKGAWIDRALTVILYFLLFVMGWRTGAIPGIASQLGGLGMTAFLFAVAALAGSWILVLLAQKMGLRPLAKQASTDQVLEDHLPPSLFRKLWNILKSPLLLLGIVLAGGIYGSTSPWNLGLNLDSLAANLVLVLVFFVGLQTGAANLDFKLLFGRKSTYLLPLLTALGSLGGGALLALSAGTWWSISPGKGAAITGGFGWYSLSSVILSAQLSAPILGTMAFLSNIFRETLSFFFIPLFARLGQSNLAIASGGATTMDVTLPILEKSAGPEGVLPALAHGIILSLLVPFVVPWMFGLGK